MTILKFYARKLMGFLFIYKLFMHVHNLQTVNLLLVVHAILMAVRFLADDFQLVIVICLVIDQLCLKLQLCIDQVCSMMVYQSHMLIEIRHCLSLNGQVFRMTCYSRLFLGLFAFLAQLKEKKNTKNKVKYFLFL